MAIVGFEFFKINVEKKDIVKNTINIANNIGIIDVEKNDLNVGNTKQAGVKFIFEYKSSYEPDFATIVLGGSIIYLSDEKTVKDVLDRWKANKQLDKEIAGQVINSILAKCNIQSILLANAVNLPPPVPMPKVNIDKGPKAAKKSAAKSEKSDSSSKKAKN